ncbi:MAG: hypothetical protein JKY95_12560 [Planctomycetaceae bacterium]|nr:hypothetical protein [Planctomycetaceae bacterium]
MASRLAIIAPNRLDLFFSSTYSFSKTYFDEKPESVQKIANQVRVLTGQQTQVKFRMDESEQKESASTETSQAVASKAPVEKHEFVQAVETIFNASIGQITRVRKQNQ